MHFPLSHFLLSRAPQVLGKIVLLVAMLLLGPIAARAGAVVIVDNGEAGTTSSGSWSASANVGCVGTNSLISVVGTGSGYYRWTPSLPAAGTYDVYAWWINSANRSQAAPFRVVGASGTSTVRMNQRVGGNRWNLLGRFTFHASGDYIELLNNTGETGSIFVSADAIRLEQVTSFPSASLTSLGQMGSSAACSLCAHSLLTGANEASTKSKYLLISDMPELFGSAGELFTTAPMLSEQSAGYPTTASRTQVNNGFTAIDDDFDLFLFHISSPGDGSTPRRICVLVENTGANPVTITPQQVLRTDGTIGSVHEMESTLALNFENATWDSTFVGSSVTVAAGARELIAYSKRFPASSTGTDRSANVNCFGRVRAAVSGTAPSLRVYVVAINATNDNSTRITNASGVAAAETAAIALLGTAATELESFSFDDPITGCTLRRATGVFPHETWRSDLLTYNADSLPGGATFQLALDDVRSVGCAAASQTSTALLYPPFLRGESIGNYVRDYRVSIRVVNDGTSARDFVLSFGNTNTGTADIGLIYRVVESTTLPDDSTVDAATAQTNWAGPGQVAAALGAQYETLATITALPPGEERYLGLWFQVLGNSSLPFQLRIEDKRPPHFDRVTSSLASASSGQTTTVRFIASEALAASPAVAVGGNPATADPADTTADQNYSFLYTVGAEPGGAKSIVLSGSDAASNAAAQTETGLFSVQGSEVDLWWIH